MRVRLRGVAGVQELVHVGDGQAAVLNRFQERVESVALEVLDRRAGHAVIPQLGEIGVLGLGQGIDAPRFRGSLLRLAEEVEPVLCLVAQVVEPRLHAGACSGHSR